MTVTNLDFVARSDRVARESPRGSLTLADAHEIWRTKFAAWVRELNLVVEASSPEGARLRLPYANALTRFGNTICGQALMACADSAMAIAIMSSFGEFRNATTVTQSIAFMRPIANADVIIEAKVKRAGKSLVFVEASFTAAGEDAVAAHATSTWMLLP